MPNPNLSLSLACVYVLGSRPVSHVASNWVSQNFPMLMQTALKMRIHYTDMVIVLGKPYAPAFHGLAKPFSQLTGHWGYRL
jgi:hypothetical protein